MQVRNRIERIEPELTATERKLSAALIADYPFAGLDTIQQFATRTMTSPPTISRFVSKLGFNGYQDFQRQLIDEVKESKRSPIDLHRADRPLQGTFLDDFTARAIALLTDAAAAMTDTQFERICGLLQNEKHGVHIIGGRISDSLATYLSNHLRQIRGNIHKLPADPESWPEYLLRIKPRDIVFIVDFRRYQPSLLKLAERANEKRNARVVLMTDKWLSPISNYAHDIIATPIESGSVWDSYAAALVLIEAILTRITENNWDKVGKRIRQWDDMRLDSEEISNDP